MAINVALRVVLPDMASERLSNRPGNVSLYNVTRWPVHFLDEHVDVDK